MEEKDIQLTEKEMQRMFDRIFSPPSVPKICREGRGLKEQFDIKIEGSLATALDAKSR